MNEERLEQQLNEIKNLLIRLVNSVENSTRSRENHWKDELVRRRERAY
jgi:hypothetical protein